MEKDAVRRHVHAALERETRINLHHHSIKIEAADGTVTLIGEVADVAAKKLALQLAAAVDGVRAVIDRLRITPGERRGDVTARAKRRRHGGLADWSADSTREGRNLGRPVPRRASGRCARAVRRAARSRAARFREELAAR